MKVIINLFYIFLIVIKCKSRDDPTIDIYNLALDQIKKISTELETLETILIAFKATYNKIKLFIDICSQIINKKYREVSQIRSLVDDKFVILLNDYEPGSTKNELFMKFLKNRASLIYNISLFDVYLIAITNDEGDNTKKDVFYFVRPIIMKTEYLFLLLLKITVTIQAINIINRKNRLITRNIKKYKDVIYSVKMCMHYFENDNVNTETLLDKLKEMLNDAVKKNDKVVDQKRKDGIFNYKLLLKRIFIKISSLCMSKLNFGLHFNAPYDAFALEKHVLCVISCMEGIKIIFNHALIAYKKSANCFDKKSFDRIVNLLENNNYNELKNKLKEWIEDNNMKSPFVELSWRYNNAIIDTNYEEILKESRCLKWITLKNECFRRYTIVFCVALIAMLTCMRAIIYFNKKKSCCQIKTSGESIKK